MLLLGCFYLAIFLEIIAFNVNFIPDYNIYIGMYNAIVASLTQLDLLIQTIV